MTNDEAIYVLKNTAWLGWDKQKEKVTEAVRMAVEALKTQLPKEDTTSDCISRQEAIRIASGYCHPANVAKELAKLPSVQPERTCVNCGRTANNGGWYADGRTRCPIEEHYALPKDGYCHLWEKRNVTDDDYPERREDERSYQQTGGY